MRNSENSYQECVDYGDSQKGIRPLGHAQPAILMYHSVAPYQIDPSNTTVHPERFEQHMEWLHERGRRGTSVGELLEAWRNGAADGLVGLSFDDGYADLAYNALPILQRYGFNATAFVLAGRLGLDNSWDAKDPRKALLTCEEVSHLAASGIEIGSHGLRHSSLPSLSRTALVSEITDSRRILQEVSGQDVLGFCYPYGHLDERAVTAAHAAGYDYACAVWATEFAGRYALRRYNMLDRYSRAHLWYMGWRYWLRWEYQGPGSGTLAAAHAWRERRRLVRKSGQTLDS